MESVPDSFKMSVITQKKGDRFGGLYKSKKYLTLKIIAQPHKYQVLQTLLKKLIKK